MKKKIAIIGGGPSALLLAAFLDATLFDITIFEKNKSLGRKFLVAGKGGFNLTHSEAIDAFVDRYTPRDFLKPAIQNFNNQDLIRWLSEIGIPTFTGSSKRIFPTQGIKPIEVLNAILKVLKNKKINFQFEHNWSNWNDQGDLVFNKTQIIKADYHIFALGGGSWKVTGSDGSWLDAFTKKGIKTKPFQAANCAFHINWPTHFINKNEGSPLKNITINCNHKTQKGEVVITSFGLEGNAIYALSPQIQSELNQNQEANIFIDLKPTVKASTLLDRYKKSSFKKPSDILRKDLNLSKPQVDLLKSQTTRDTFLNPELLVSKIKNLPLTVLKPAPIDEAISTTGGIELSESDQYFKLKKLNNSYCIGEMLDWNAPTGGYLLQACFSMGVYLAKHLNQKEKSNG